MPDRLESVIEQMVVRALSCLPFNKQKNWLVAWLCLCLMMLCCLESAAQPPNNNWANALTIAIPDNSFGVGTIQGTTVNMTGATSQAGEYLQNPTYPKTVWYKFSIPSHRLVRVKISQPLGGNIPGLDAGFSVYHSTAGLPGVGDLAVFTPMLILDSYTENVCLEQGEYYIQMVAKNSVNSDLFVELNVSYTYPVSTSHAHDQVESTANIGTLTTGHNHNFSWDCLSIQSQKEYNSYFAADSINFTKSIWYRFTTDSHIDMFSYYVSYPVWGLNNAPISIRIFEGAVNLATLDTSAAIYSTVRPLNTTLTNLPCLLKPNTEYYVQLLGRINYTGTSTFHLRHLGEGITTGAYPQEAAFNPLNDFGTVIPTPSPGTTVTRQDYFSCETLLTNDSIQCGVVNPPNSVTAGALTYDMTTWFTLDVPNPANVLLRAYTQSQYCNSQYYNHGMYVRIFNQTPDNDCINFSLPGSLYYEGQFNANGAIIMNCLPAGNYSIQILARSGLNTNPYDCNNAQFGRSINFSINLMGVPTTEYALLSPGDVDWINTGIALQDNIWYTADSSSFSCEKTVIPDTAICSNIVDRAMYRQFIIDDANNDMVPDSGMVTIENYNYYNEIQNHLVKSVFYKGDAEQLAAAQNVYSWPDQLDGLDPYQGCNMYNNFFRPNWPYNVPHSPKKFCVTPGTYTLVNVGDSTENGAIMAPRFRFTKSTTNHWDPNNAYNMGDIIAQNLNVLSPADTFSCRDNAATIAGLAPCAGYTKLIYREFYISQACRITVNEISSTQQPTSQMRVFSGRVSTGGIAGLSLAPYHAGGCYNHYSGYSLPACATVPEGWYTAVSYGYGPTYDNNYAFHEATTYNNYTNLYNIDHTTSIRVIADTTVPPGPFFNRPWKACVANNDNPLTWVNTGTASVPSAATNYTLCMERFKPLQDTPYSAIPILGCAGTVRMAFYVFTTDEEYYVRISGVDGYSKELYPLDVRIDSLLLPTTTPIAGCTNTGNIIEVCRLQPGTYTLVVYGTPTQDCITFTPAIAVQPVDISRFDFAVNAYDFGLVPGDNVYHPGAIGDIHPTDPTLLPSNDFFYCTTGAFASDPSGACTNTLYPPIYPDTINNAYFQEPGTQTWYKRRNLWYTFVVQGMGQASITIRNRTNPGSPIPFRMYLSDVDANIPFDDLYALGELDSTLVSGLTAVHTNMTGGGWCSRLQESTYTFINDICLVDTLKRRYYIVAELDEYYTSYPNVQMDLQIRWSPINSNPQDPKYDFYSHANVIGNNEDAPPYTDTPLQYNTFYTGGWGNMSCATGDAADALFYNDYWGCQYYSLDQRSLWWKFRIDQPGFIHLAAESDATPASSFTRRLLKQIATGDSVISINGTTDLHSLGTGSGVGVPGGAPHQWYRYCVDPGEYYYHVQRCADVDTSNVRAHAYFTTITGDNCFNATTGTAPTFGVYPLSIPVLCHTMGNDFGEDGSNMGCLQGPQGYKSTWFKFSYTGTDIADILFQLNLSGLSNYISPANVRYRIFYGSDCATMIAGAECSTNAYINNSIACVTNSNGAFYVQVVYPEGASGTLGFTFTVSPTTNPDCTPFDPSLIISDFFYQPNCTGDSLIFFNYATSGSSVEYLWDFGDGETSTEDNPIHAYAPGDYEVTLYVINPVLGDTASMTQTVTLSPSGSPLDLGDDLTICFGESVSIGQLLTLATYQWSTGEQTDFIDVSNPGWYFLDIVWGGCPYSDSIQIHVIDLAFDLGQDIFFCEGESATLQPTVYPGVDFLWSDGSTADTLLINQAGQYYLDISIGNCIQSDTVEVDVLDLSFTLGSDTTICFGNTITLSPTVNIGVDYLWSDNSTGSSLTTDTEGTYSLTIEQLGCSASDEITIDVLDLSFSLGNDTLFCVNESVLLSPVVTSGVSFLWNAGASSPSLIVNTEGQYYLNIELLGCTASDTIYVSELDLTFTLGNDTTVCQGASLLLAPVVLGGVNFDWSTNQTSSSISVNTTGVYSLTIESQGCDASDDIDVDVLDLAFTLGNDTTICNGSSVTIQTQVLPGVNFVWSNGSTTNSITVSAADTYTLEIDSLGCTAQDEIIVSIFYVDAIVPTSSTICLNDTADIIASSIDSLIWTSGASIEEYSPVHFGLYPTNTTIYNWIAYENGCTETGTTTINVLQPYIPNVVYDDFYCNNEYEVELPVVPGTTGNYYFNNTLINELLILGLAANDYEIDYLYTDDVNNCPWEITLPFQIADTTTLAFTSIPQICIDAVPFNLNTIINVSGGNFNVSYLSGGQPSVSTSNYDPNNIADPLNNPTIFGLEYSYTNAQTCVSHAEGSIEVHPLPIALFTVDAVCLNDTAVFINNSSVNGTTIDTYLWELNNFNDFTTSLPYPVYYNQPGLHPVTLTVESTIGCSASYTSDLMVNDLPQITIDPYGPFCKNLGAIDLPTATPIGGNWWNGSVQISSLNTLSLTQTNDIVYQYTDANGCFNSTEITFFVNDTAALSIVNPLSSLCINSGITALDDVVNIQGGQWSAQYDGLNWSDVTEFNTQSIIGFNNIPTNVALHYEFTNDHNCISTLNTFVVVHPMPVIEIDLTNACIGEAIVVSNNSSVNGSSINSTVWNFEQHGSTPQSEPTGISYTQEGQYEYSLTVTSAIGCMADTTGEIIIYQLPVAAFTWEGGCVNEPVLFFDNSASSAGDIALYSWHIDGNEFGNNASSEQTFNVPGNHDVQLVVTSTYGCVGEVTLPIDILPIPTGSIQAENHCFGESTAISSQFTSSSGTIVSSIWNIAGEVENTTAPTLLHTFSTTGVFQIEQTVESENGCINVLHDSIEVYPLPVPSFVTNRFELCLNDRDTIYGTSQVEDPFTIEQHHWSFSNGYSAQGSSIIFVGQSVGPIHLELTTTTNVGCSTSIEASDVYMVRPNPAADFTLSPDVLSYEQPEVEITDASTGSTSWQYQISDGGLSTEPNFVHEFLSDGTYDVLQIVTNQYGCKDTTSKSILFVPGLLVHIPNAFTPDNDGLNDVFHPVISGDDITKYSFIIWDRWGMEIFNSTNPEEVWMGNVLGGNHYAKTEVYNYRLVIRGKSTDELVFQGSVTLLR